MSNDQGENGNDSIKYEYFIQYRNQLIERKAEQSKSFDKYVLTLSAGALGLSLVFIEKIASNPQSLIVLYISWLSLVLTILATLMSFIFSTYACDRYRKHWDQWFRESPKRDVPQIKSAFTQLTGFLNWVSCVTFIIGVATLCIFAIKNIAQAGG